MENDDPGHDGLLLVGHGSRRARSLEEARAIADLLALGLPGVDVALGFLEMCDPPASSVLDALVARGRRRIVVVPLVLLAAGHAKSDVPALVLEGRRRHPGVDIRLANPPGISHTLVAALGEAVVRAGGSRMPLLVVARGTSDPDANGDASKVARLVAEWTGAPFVHTAFTGVTSPSVAEGLDVFRRLGHPALALAFWFLCDGWLVERARDEIEAFHLRSGLTVLDAGYLGPDPRVADALGARYHDALASRPSVNCDLCAYRAPWPGLEGRLGQALGVGHSHLAASHLAASHLHQESPWTSPPPPSGKPSSPTGGS